MVPRTVSVTVLPIRDAFLRLAGSMASLSSVLLAISSPDSLVVLEGTASTKRDSLLRRLDFLVLFFVDGMIIM